MKLNATISPIKLIRSSVSANSPIQLIRSSVFSRTQVNDQTCTRIADSNDFFRKKYGSIFRSKGKILSAPDGVCAPPPLRSLKTVYAPWTNSFSSPLSIMNTNLPIFLHIFELDYSWVFIFLSTFFITLLI